jgi:ribosomal protein L7/L12
MAWFTRSKTTRPDMVAVLLPEPLASEVDELLRKDEEIKAIRLVRERTGLGLLPAHNAVKNRRTT